MITGATVKQLAARLIHIGQQKSAMIPVIYHREGALSFHFESRGAVIGRIDRTYVGDDLLREIRDAQRLVDVPTIEVMYETFLMTRGFVAKMGSLG